MIEELKDKELTDKRYLRARMTGNVGLAIDYAYNLGFFDGEKNAAKKIRAEIENVIQEETVMDNSGTICGYEFVVSKLDPDDVFQIIDKYREESKDNLADVREAEEEQDLCEGEISRYQKIKQMLYEFKEMPLAPCLMKGHICAVHEILNEVIEPSASSSEKPRLIDPAYEKTLNKWIGAEVLDRIRNEMHATAEKHEDGVYYLRDEWVDEIIDKYKAEGSEKG